MSLDIIKLRLDNIPETTAQDTVNSNHRITGEILCFHLEISAASNIDVDVFLLANGAGAIQEQVWAADNITASATIYPRSNTQGATNVNITYDGTRQVHAPYCALGQTLQLSAGDSDTASIDVVLTVLVRTS